MQVLDDCTESPKTLQEELAYMTKLTKNEKATKRQKEWLIDFTFMY